MWHGAVSWKINNCTSRSTHCYKSQDTLKCYQWQGISSPALTHSGYVCADISARWEFTHQLIHKITNTFLWGSVLSLLKILIMKDISVKFFDIDFQKNLWESWPMTLCNPGFLMNQFAESRCCPATFSADFPYSMTTISVQTFVGYMEKSYVK
jgi:hypothetical protein